MKAAVLYDRAKPLQVEEVTLDEPKEQEVLVKMVATGVCHTDYHVVTGDIGLPLPIVLGHEGAGIVEKIGPGVTTLQPGDHVVLVVIWSCGKCAYCARGMPSQCPMGFMSLGSETLPQPGGGKRLRNKDNQELGHFFNQSSFAEYAVVHERTAIKIRDDAPLEVACLLGCGTTTGVGSALNLAGVKAGQSIAIYGCGGVGLSAIMGAKLAGANPIIAVDLLDQKLEWAKELGADYGINASQENAPQRIIQLTAGGADCAIECIGNAEASTQAFASIGSVGKCVLVGSYPPTATMTIAPSGDFTTRGKTLTGGLQGGVVASVDIPKYVDLYMAGKLPVDKLISRNYSLDQINDAFAALKDGEVMRSIIRF